MNLLTGTSRRDVRALVKQEMGMVGGGLTTLPDPERQEEKTARLFLPRVVGCVCWIQNSLTGPEPVTGAMKTHVFSWQSQARVNLSLLGCSEWKKLRRYQGPASGSSQGADATQWINIRNCSYSKRGGVMGNFKPRFPSNPYGNFNVFIILSFIYIHMYLTIQPSPTPEKYSCNGCLLTSQCQKD